MNTNTPKHHSPRSTSRFPREQAAPRPLRTAVFTALALLPAASLTVACGGAEGMEDFEYEDVETVTEEIVSRTTPQPSKTPSTPAALPPFGFNFNTHSFVPGSQLAPAPKTLVKDSNPPQNSRTLEGWLTDIEGNDGFNTTPAFRSQLDLAVRAAQNAQATEDTSTTQLLSSGIKPIAAGAGWTVAVAAATQKGIAYDAARGRWLQSQKTASGTSTFAAPGALDELRQRGARLFCSASNAFSKKAGAPVLMGKKSLASVNIFGKRIDFMSLEPTVAMASPDKFASPSNDGAQAFNIPLTVGTRVTPISLLDSLPEVRTPVTMVTGDSEAVTKAELTSTTHKQWQTVTHADAFVSSQRSLRVDTPKFPIFAIGPVPVTLGLTVKLETNACSNFDDKNPLTTHAAACKSATLQPPGRLLNPPSNIWPAARTGGWTNGTGIGSYNDAPWDWSFFGAHVNPTDPLRLMSWSANDAMSTRMMQDDDKVAQVLTTASLTGTLSAGFTKQNPLNIADTLYVGVELDGSLGVSGSMVHTVREQEEIFVDSTPDLDDLPMRTPRMETSLSVTPSTAGEITLGTDVSAYLGLDLPVIGRVNVGGKLVEAEGTLASSQSAAWPEQNRLRIGTALNRPGRDIKTQPSVPSHWPREASFDSFPSTVSACLGSAAPTGDLQPPCGQVKPTPPPGGATTAPSANLCMYSNGREQWPDASDAEVACISSLTSFVRGGSPANRPTFPFRGSNVHTRVLNMSPGEAAELKAVAAACAAGLGTATAVDDFMGKYRHIAACDASGRPMETIQAVSDTSNGAPPSDSSGQPNACR